MKFSSNKKRHAVWLALLLAFALAQPLQAINSRHRTETNLLNIPAVEAAAPSKLIETYGNLPLSFEENRGQADSRVKYLSRGPDYNLFLTATEAIIQLGASSARPGADRRSWTTMSNESHFAAAAEVRMRLIGSNRAARLAGAGELPGKSNYFIGNDPKKWRVNIPTCDRVIYEDVYPNVNAVFYGNQRQLEYDFILAAGADFKSIRLAFDGVRRILLDDSGDLKIETAAGEMLQRAPVAYQEKDGIKQLVAARYVLKNNREVGFEIGAYDRNRTLIIDPVLSYSTYLGTGVINDIAVDQTGNAYVTGGSPSGSSFDAFVMKLNSEGTAVVYSALLSGGKPGSQTQGLGIAVDSNGNAYVTGSTNSENFPTTAGAFQTTQPGTGSPRTSAFITKLSLNGASLVYSTYLGGADSFSASGSAIAVDRTGSADVIGSTNSFKFPTANPLQAANSGGFCIGGDVIFPCQMEAFVTKLNPQGTGLVYSTYLGGFADDIGSGITVDSAGSAYVVGSTSGNGPPLKNAVQTSRNGDSDLFIAKLTSEGNELVYSTLLGGNATDTANGVAVDSSGNAWVTGTTFSTDFPTTADALQSVNANSTAFKSTDGGATWTAINRGLSGTNFAVRQLVLDPANAAVLFANTDRGLFKSTNGGNSWGSISTRTFTTVAIDPTDSSVLYGGLFFVPFGGGLDKSTDGGRTWFNADRGLDRSPPVSILIDPQNPATLYTALQFFGQNSPEVFKSTDGGANWVPSGKGIDRPSVILAMDPVKSKILYAVVSNSCVFKSTNRAKRWHLLSCFSSANTLAVDPVNRHTVYLATSTGVLRSFDGESFSATALRANVAFLAIDPKNTSIIYAAARTGSDRLFKSTNGGDSWTAIGTEGLTNQVSALAIDPNNTSVIYAGTFGFPSNVDAFAVKINPSGTFLTYSTYLGGARNDISRKIAVDAQGRAYLTGQTSSDDFPIKDAFQPRRTGSPESYDAFLTRFESNGGLASSTYLGGSRDDIGSGIALDAAGSVYIAGTTLSDDFPTLNPIQATRTGSAFATNGFVTKIVNAGSSAQVFGRSSR